MRILLMPTLHIWRKTVNISVLITTTAVKICTWTTSKRKHMIRGCSIEIVIILLIYVVFTW